MWKKDMLVPVQKNYIKNLFKITTDQYLFCLYMERYFKDANTPYTLTFDKAVYCSHYI